MNLLPAERLFSLALWLAGAGHFSILFASFQVPHRLQWSSELARLQPLNRKLMWTYGAFTVLMICAFGTLTLALHAELLRGDRTALGLAMLIGSFWSARVAVDFFYFEHHDWPPGRMLLIGHVLLTSLFVFLAGTYLGLVIWHVWVRP
jgi:alginate O-acetyltransferase complex protein AlgI